MRRARLFLAGTLGLLVAACTQLGIVAANFPARLADTQVTRGVVFDGDTGLALDVYAPKSASRPLPVVVFFYGGRWTFGERADYAFVGAALAERGYIVVVPDYRKYPHVRFPAFVEDGASAVAWTRRNIAAYGGDASRIFLSGHSSGAHIASLLAADERYLAARGLPRNAVVGFAGLAGPYAFIPQEADLKDMFGPPENYPRMQTLTHVDGGEPPMLLLYGGRDEAVGAFNHEKLEEKIRARAGRVKTIVYPALDHVWIVGAISWLGRDRAPVLDDIVRFFESVP